MRRRAAMLLIVAIATAGCADGDGDARSTTDPTSASTAATTTVPVTSTTLPSFDGAVVIAHRGASAYAPEHTSVAYDRALELGADYLEQDLQLTSDGELVVLHDETLDRTARGPADACTGPVATKTLAQVRTCDMGSWFNEAHPDLADPSFVGLRIMTMSEVLERYRGRARFYIETKAPEANPGLEEKLLDLLADDGPGVASVDRPVVLQSFSAESLRSIHSVRPDVPLVQLFDIGVAPTDPATLDAVAEYATGIGPFFGNTDAAVIAAAHDRCLDVHPWTVDDPAQMDRLLELGVDGMFSNTTDVLAEHSAGRGPALRSCG